MELNRFKQLLESTMGNVKPLLSENEMDLIKGERYKKMFLSNLNNAASDLRLDGDDEFIEFINPDGKIIFRYDIENFTLMYSINEILKIFFFTVRKTLTNEEMRYFSELVCEWANDKLVHRFYNEIDDEFAVEFEILDCQTDEDIYNKEEGFGVEVDDEEGYDDYGMSNVFGDSSLDAPLRDSNAMEYLEGFNDLDAIEKTQPQKKTLYRYEEKNNMFVVLHQFNGDLVYVNKEIWATLREQYGLSSQELRELIQEWMNNTFDLNISTPLLVQYDEGYHSRQV